MSTHDLGDRVGISSSIINHEIPFAPPTMSSQQYQGFEDLLRAYSPFGQIRSLFTLFRPGIGIAGYSGSAESFSLDHVMSRSLGLSGFNAGLDREIYGGGKGLGLFDMVVSTAGEAAERMLGTLAVLDSLAPGKTVMATSEEMLADGRRIVDPEMLRMFHEQQLAQPGFVCEAFTPTTRLAWMPGTHYLTGEEVWMPSQLVHLLHLTQQGEARVGYSTSGGLATHIDEANVLYHGVLELMERDAINLRWFCHIPPARIEIDRPFRDDRMNKWLEEAERADMDVKFYYHTLEHVEVPVVTAVCWDEQLSRMSYFAGGGTGLDTEEALRSALGELVQSERMTRVPTVAPGWQISKGIARLFGISADAQPTEFQNFIQVVAYYGYAQNRDQLKWYFEPEDQVVVKLSELPEFADEDGATRWEFVQKLLAKYDLNPVVFDFTPDVFSTIRLLKVTIPELVPAFPPNLPMLGHRRYRELPQRLGYRDSPMDYSELETSPLPYP